MADWQVVYCGHRVFFFFFFTYTLTVTLYYTFTLRYHYSHCSAKRKANDVCTRTLVWQRLNVCDSWPLLLATRQHRSETDGSCQLIQIKMMSRLGITNLMTSRFSPSLKRETPAFALCCPSVPHSPPFRLPVSMRTQKFLTRHVSVFLTARKHQNIYTR